MLRLLSTAQLDRGEILKKDVRETRAIMSSLGQLRLLLFDKGLCSGFGGANASDFPDKILLNVTQCITKFFLAKGFHEGEEQGTDTWRVLAFSIAAILV